MFKMIAVLGMTLVLVAVASSKPVDCNGPNRRLLPICEQKNWHLGVDTVRPSGAVVHGHANTPVSSDGLQGSIHGSRVFGGPSNGATSVGGGVNYQHPNGLHGGVDVTHHRGQGNVVSGTVGGSTKIGPGTLTVGGGANTIPGSSKIQGQVGATYSVPLP